MATPCLARAVLLGTLLIAGVASSVRAAGPVAAGRVTDLQGHAVAGALVQVQSWESKALGAARSDAQGRFQMPLSQPVEDPTLIVEHPGFQRWALSGASPEADGSYHIRLTRRIDREYLTELAAQAGPARFLLLARDLLAPSQGTVGDTLPLAQVLPFLKALRPRLRTLLPAKPPLFRRMDLREDQQKVMLLLAYLGDPRDDALVDAWADDENGVSRPPKPCRGATPDAAALEWQKAHFEQEGYGPSQPSPYNILQTQIAPAGDHGLVVHTVRYAHWGYIQHGVVVRLQDGWEVRRVILHERWHSHS